MNVDQQAASASTSPPQHPSTPVLEPVYRSLCWVDVVNIRALNPKCNPTKEAMARAALHPDSVFGREVETYIGRTTTGEPARNAQQAAALRRLSTLEDHEVTIDALRDTGLPEALAVDVVRRLLPRATGWTIFERIAGTPTLDIWAQSVLTREGEAHVADDILTLRILQTFGHDIAVPWSFDTVNKRVSFYSAVADRNGSLGRMLDIATLDRPACYAMRDACRKAYQALAYCHYGAGGQVWPHWEATRDIWQIHPDPREGAVIDDIVSHCAVTCDTERWLRDVTTVGALNVTGCSPRTGPDYESDLSDPENVTCDPRRARVAPGELRQRLAVTAAHRRAAQRAALPPPPPPPPPPVAPSATRAPGAGPSSPATKR